MRLPKLLEFVLPVCLAVPMPVLAFDRGDLTGLWAESLHSRYACTPSNRYQRFELSGDGKHLVIAIQKSRTHAGETMNLDVTRTDEHSLYVQFAGHTDAADPLAGEWAMTMPGPGVYRWHLASEHDTLRPAPIGVRCAP